MARSLHELAKEAIDIQNGSSLCGLVQGWARTVIELKNILNCGTDELNRHPINQLWADKMADLAGIRTMEKYSEAYEVCRNLSIS